MANCTTCKTTTITPCASGCASTINSDCVIYSGDALPFEASNVDDGDKRTLSSILGQIPVTSKESKIINFNSDGTTDDGDSYTVVEEDLNKILILKQTDAGEANVDYQITLPETEEFINGELIIKDISAAADSGVTTINITFNLDITYEWNPVATTDDFDILCDSTHRTLKLRFIKTTPTSYQWVVCP